MGDSMRGGKGDTLVIDTVGLKAWLLDAYHPTMADRRVAQRQDARRRTPAIHGCTNASYDVTMMTPHLRSAVVEH